MAIPVIVAVLLFLVLWVVGMALLFGIPIHLHVIRCCARGSPRDEEAGDDDDGDESILRRCGAWARQTLLYKTFAFIGFWFYTKCCYRSQQFSNKWVTAAHRVLDDNQEGLSRELQLLRDGGEEEGRPSLSAEDFEDIIADTLGENQLIQFAQEEDGEEQRLRPSPPPPPKGKKD